ncbi:hypothetical protein MHYP_G00361050 [Metynnis hypsauchen]
MITDRKPDFEFLNADPLFENLKEVPFIWAYQSKKHCRHRKRGRKACILVWLRRQTWLSAEIPNEAIEPAGFSVHHADRTKDLCGKRKGGGVCFMINNAWCDQRNVHFIESFCSLDLEYLIISCRPMWLPREISGLTVTAVYIPPEADTDLALGKLLEAVNKQETTRPRPPPLLLGTSI